MEKKSTKSSDRELMKMAMLKHEQIFRQQVYELHRLYRTQKILMNGVRNSNTINQQINTSGISNNDQINGSCRSNQRQAEEKIADLNCQGSGLIKESEIQLTLGPSDFKTSHDRKRSSSGQSFSSSNSTSSQNPDTEAPTSEGCAWEFGEQVLRQNRTEQHPPWMYQALTLKLT